MVSTLPWILSRTNSSWTICTHEVTRPGWFGNPMDRKVQLQWRSPRNLRPACRPATWRAVAMVDVSLGSAERPLRRILCLGSHCDDIEIGCGGTILRLLREHPEAEIYWLVFSSDPGRRKEAARAANLVLSSAQEKKGELRNYRDSVLPSQQARRQW